jgi:cyanate permease
MMIALAGGAAGPWVTGVLHDRLGDYNAAFGLGIVMSAISGAAVFLAAPRKVRAVAGRLPAPKPA